MPFPSTRVIHPAWAAHHAPVAVGTMNATCTITHASTGGGWDPVTGPAAATPAVTYTGPCRVTYRDARGGDGDAADQSTSILPVLVALPLTALPQQVGARITITAVDANGPVGLAGRTLTVRDVGNSSLTFEQDLTCTDDQTNQPGV